MRFWGILLLLPSLLWAQPEFFGYFESEGSTMQLGNSNYNFGFNKFRLDVEARPNDHILIGANITAQQYWGQTTWNLLDFIPEQTWRPYFYVNPLSSSSYEPSVPVTLTDTLFLDNVYMKLSMFNLDVTLGRQQLSTGVGYAWNPTDIFNSKSLLDPSYEQTGVKALRLDIALGDRSTISAIVLPEAEVDQSTQQYTLKTGVGSFDLAATTTYQSNQDWVSTLLGRFDVVERNMFGGSIIGELVGWGVWLEGAYNILQVEMPLWSSYKPPDPEETYSEYVVGADHTFDNSIYFLTEYLHNGFGVAKQEDLRLNNYFATLGGETHSLMQDYLFIYAMHPTFDFVSLSALVIANLNDNSGTFAPQLDWNAFEDTNISLQGSLFWGEDDTEFGLQDWGLRLRVRSDF